MYPYIIRVSFITARKDFFRDIILEHMPDIGNLPLLHQVYYCQSAYYHGSGDNA